MPSKKIHLFPEDLIKKYSDMNYINQALIDDPLGVNNLLCIALGKPYTITQRSKKKGYKRNVRNKTASM